MARASGTQEWVKTGPVEQVGGVSRCRCPPGRPPGIPPSLTGRLGDDQAAAAEGQASVRDGAEGDEDLPPALRREAVEPHLPLRRTEWMSGTRHPGVRPHGAPQTHQRAARRPVPSPHLQPAGPVGTQLQEVELQPTDTTELCEKAAWGADTGGRTSRPFPPHPQSRGARPSHPCPYLRRGGPGAPAGRAGRAARAGTAGPCSAPGRAASAGARARAGPAGGSGGGSACCRLAGVWGGERAERGCRAPGVPPTAGTGSPGEGGNPGDREPRRPSGAGSREQGEGPELAARPRSRPRRYSPVARHSCKQRDGGERSAARRPPPRFPPPPPAPPRCSRSWRRPGGG